LQTQHKKSAMHRRYDWAYGGIQKTIRGGRSACGKSGVSLDRAWLEARG
jgi:hypothetical protein